jgi:tetratricopeptide (TPR) repeat protein
MKSLKLIIRAVTGLSLFLVLSAPGHGEGVTPSDYYGNEYGMRLLKDVEEHHLGPGIERMNGKSHMWIYAMQDFDFILAYYPNHPRGLQLKAEIAMKLGKPQLAEQSFRKAIELYPHTTSTYILYAVFLQQNGKLDAAEANYKTALNAEPNSAAAHYNLGLLYCKKQQYAAANLHAQRAYALGYPLPGLRKKLMAVKAWNPAPAGAADAPGPAATTVKSPPAEKSTPAP